MRKTKYVQVLGTEYTCRFRYRSSKSLDRISKFLLEEVLVQEQEISRLIQTFSLPHALVSDILSELVQQNLATINFSTGTIRRTGAAPSSLKPVESDRERSVWQDMLTGAFLPLNEIVRALAVKRQAKSTLPLGQDFRFESFIDAPKNRILSELRSQQPDIEIDHTLTGDVADWQVDEIVDRQRLQSLPLYIPYDDILIPGSDNRRLICLIEPSIPYWLVKSWSKALQQGITSRDLRDIAVKRVEENRSEFQDQFDDCELGSLLSRWKRTTLSRFNKKPAFPDKDNPDPDELSNRLLEEIESERKTHQQDLLMRLRRSLQDRAEVKPLTKGGLAETIIAQAESHLVVCCSHRDTIDRLCGLNGHLESVVFVGTEDAQTDNPRIHSLVAPAAPQHSFAVADGFRILFFDEPVDNAPRHSLVLESRMLANRLLEGLSRDVEESDQDALARLINASLQLERTKEQNVGTEKLVGKVEKCLSQIDERVQELERYVGKDDRPIDSTVSETIPSPKSDDVRKGRSLIECESDFLAKYTDRVPRLAANTELIQSLVTTEVDLPIISFLPTTCLSDWFTFFCLASENSKKPASIVLVLNQVPVFCDGWPDKLKALMQHLPLSNSQTRIATSTSLTTEETSKIRDAFRGIHQSYFRFGEFSIGMPDAVGYVCGTTPFLVFGDFERDSVPCFAVQSASLWQELFEGR